MSIEEQRDNIIEQLEMLNTKMQRQNSVGHIFLAGIIHGIGFFIGSAIIATIVLGILSPWLGQVEWIREVFERGAALK